MVSSGSSGTETDIIVRRTRRYRWPAFQLNFWLLVQIIGAATILGINAYFLTVQNQLEIGIPWYFGYWIATTSLALFFFLLKIWLISQNNLLPGVVLIGSFILFVLYLVGLIVYSIELWGGSGVNSTCSVYVNAMPYSGKSIETLAWLEQSSICQAWIASWAFELVGCVFLLWMWLMSWRVYRDF